EPEEPPPGLEELRGGGTEAWPPGKPEPPELPPLLPPELPELLPGMLPVGTPPLRSRSRMRGSTPPGAPEPPEPLSTGTRIWGTSSSTGRGWATRLAEIRDKSGTSRHVRRRAGKDVRTACLFMAVLPMRLFITAATAQCPAGSCTRNEEGPELQSSDFRARRSTADSLHLCYLV